MSDQPTIEATPNLMNREVLLIPPSHPGASAGVLVRLGYPLQRVETLMDMDMAEEVANAMIAAVRRGRTLETGLILPDGIPL